MNQLLFCSWCDRFLCKNDTQRMTLSNFRQEIISSIEELKETTGNLAAICLKPALSTEAAQCPDITSSEPFNYVRRDLEALLGDLRVSLSTSTQLQRKHSCLKAKELKIFDAKKQLNSLILSFQRDSEIDVEKRVEAARRKLQTVCVFSAYHRIRRKCRMNCFVKMKRSNLY